MKLSCPSCAKLVQSPEGWDGRQFSCPHCGHAVGFSVDGSAPPAEEIADELTTVDEESGSPVLYAEPLADRPVPEVSTRSGQDVAACANSKKSISSSALIKISACIASSLGLSLLLLLAYFYRPMQRTLRLRRAFGQTSEAVHLQKQLTLEDLVFYLELPRPLARRRAVAAYLIVMCHPFAVREMTPLLGDLDPAVRVVATRGMITALARSGYWIDPAFVVWEGPPPVKIEKVPLEDWALACDQLRPLLADPNREVRANSIVILGALRDGDAVPHLYEKLFDLDEGVRLLAEDALLNIGSYAAQDALAVWGLRSVLSNPAAVLTKMRDANANTRASTVRSLGQLGARGKPAVPVIERTLADPDAGVRTATRKALRAIFSSPDDNDCVIIAGVGLAKHGIGDSADSIRTALGRPEKIKKVGAEELWVYHRKGMEVVIAGGRVKAMLFHYRLGSYLPFMGKTARDVYGGSGVEGAMRIYGKPRDPTSEARGEVKGTTKLEYKQLGICFIFEEDALASIVVTEAQASGESKEVGQKPNGAEE